jgi:hypothetical protein
MSSSSNAAGNFPIALEMWQNLEITLMNQAKKLVEDIAKKQGVDSKELLTKVKSQIRIGLLDIEVPDDNISFCSHMVPFSTGAIKMRCRSPCLLGFSSCPEHAGKPDSGNLNENISFPPVTRIFDLDNKHYFVDSYGIARDRNGRAKGIVSTDESEEEILRLFETWKKPPTAKEKEGEEEA